MKVHLDEKRVKGLRCPEDKSQVFLWDVSLRGFGVRCTRKQAKSFVVQCNLDGVPTRRTIGQLGEWTLTTAREEAGRLLHGMRAGRDPNVVRAQAQADRAAQRAQGMTLRQVAVDYCEHKRNRYKRPLSPRTQADIHAIVARSFADWADQPVASITRDMCVARFDELSKRGGPSAKLAFVILRALLNRARDLHLGPDGNPTILAVNPVVTMLRVREFGPDNERETRIPLDHIGTAVNYLRQRTTHASDLALFMLLTGCREGESVSLTWSQLALDDTVPTFTLPATKTVPITLPLCSQLVDMLRARMVLPRWRGNHYVFQSHTRGTGHMEGTRGPCEHLSKLTGEHVHPHALRRTFEDMAVAVGIDSDQRRLLLNHAAKDAHGRSYANNRDPKVLLPLVQRIGDWADAQAVAAAGANVVELRQA